MKSIDESGLINGLGGEVAGFCLKDFKLLLVVLKLKKKNENKMRPKPLASSIEG